MSERAGKLNVTIASSASLSGAIGAYGRLVGIQMPSSWTAADLTFQVSTDNGTTYQNVYEEDGSEYVVTADASRFIAITGLPRVDAIKVRSGTSGTAVAQGAARTLTLFVERSS